MPPDELRILHEAAEAAPGPDFWAAIRDPLVNASVRSTRPAPAPRKGVAKIRRLARIDAALAMGPDALDDRQKLMLLDDSEALATLHARIRASDGAHPAWKSPAPR